MSDRRSRVCVVGWNQLFLDLVVGTRRCETAETYHLIKGINPVHRSPQNVLMHLEDREHSHSFALSACRED